MAVTLLHRKGYFSQRLDHSGWQFEEPAQWAIEDFLKDTAARTTVTIEGRNVEIRAWVYNVESPEINVPVLLLDTNLELSSPWDRTLSAAGSVGYERNEVSSELSSIVERARWMVGGGLY